jgi:hypothetical protein
VNALKYKSSLDGLLTILNEEGVEGLYKGVGSKLTQSVLTAAILFAGQRRIFELMKNVCYAAHDVLKGPPSNFPTGFSTLYQIVTLMPNAMGRQGAGHEIFYVVYTHSCQSQGPMRNFNVLIDSGNRQSAFIPG